MKVRTQSKIIGASLLTGALALSGVVTASAVTTPAHARSAIAVQSRTAKAKTKKVSFKGRYTGNISMLWSSSAVTVTVNG